MARILGIDFGMKRTGLAVTDPSRIIVTGLETQLTSVVFSFIRNYVERESVEKIVVGYPFLEGGFGDPVFHQKLDTWIAQLRKEFSEIEVVLQDERFTSHDARQILV